MEHEEVSPQTAFLLPCFYPAAVQMVLVNATEKNNTNENKLCEFLLKAPGEICN